jgi:hypothetical protein
VGEAKRTACDSSGEQRGWEFNLFGFVTDNPSSHTAIHLAAVPSPAEDGNVGQRLYVLVTCVIPRLVYPSSYCWSLVLEP